MSRTVSRAILVGLFLLAGAGSLLADQDPFLVLAGPKDVVRFDLTDEEGKTVWVLEAKPPRNPDFLMYGEVPEGFAQVEPVDGEAPRLLIPGELLTIETTTMILVFTHTGVASGMTNMEIVNYSMKRREPTD